MICEYNGSVVDVYGDKLKEVESGCRKELGLRVEERRIIRWNDVCKCSRCVQRYIEGG